MKKVIVTGGDGYIGQHVCKHLKDLGFFVIVIDNMSNSKKITNFCDQHHIIDVRSPKLNLIFENNNDVWGVIHLAAQAYVEDSVINPEETFDINVNGGLNILKCMRQNDIKNIIFSSTCATYGEYDIPISENLEQKPVNPYGYSKLVMEKMIEEFCRAYDMSAVCLRYFNVGGASDCGEIGEDHDPETHVIPLLLKSILNKNTNFHIFGEDYDTRDGTCIRDYVHVDDIAMAHIKSIDYLITNRGIHRFNLGSGAGTSVKELINCVEKVTDSKIEVTIGERRKGDPPMLLSDINHSYKELGWRPSKNLDNIVRSAWRWELNKYNTKGDTE